MISARLVAAETNTWSALPVRCKISDKAASLLPGCTNTPGAISPNPSHNNSFFNWFRSLLLLNAGGAMTNIQRPSQAEMAGAYTR